MIHLYCGDGKGKTTAGMGLILRQLAIQKQVLLIQFLKDGTSSELKILKHFPNLTLLYHPLPKLFFMQMDEKQQLICKQQQQNLWNQMLTILSDYDCIFLDEIIDACNLHLIAYSDLLQILKNHPQKEWILTGRNPDVSILTISDYYSEIIAKKHPFEKGIQARIGVEY